MQHETIAVTAPDGALLNVERWLPDAPPTAVVHLMHGMAEHAGRYHRLAEAITARGWALWAADHRGHGKTPGPIGHFADEDGWEVVMRDQRALLDAERDAHPGLPIVALGHSLGTIFARDVAIRWGDELSALVLSAAPGSQGLLGVAGLVLAKREAAKDPAAPSQRLNDLSFGGYNKAFRPARTDFDWLTRDEAEVDAYVADEQCGFVCTAGFFRDMLTGLTRVTDPKILRRVPDALPVLVATGGADPVTKNGKSTRAIASMLAEGGSRDVTTVVFEGARHEIFNETNGDDTTRVVMEWVASRLR